LLAWVAVLVGSSINWWQYALSVVLAMSAGLLPVLTSGSRRYGWLGVVPSALLLLTAIGFVRNSASGFSSGVGALAILPVFQTALYSHSRRDLFIVLAGLAVFFLLPILLIGAPGYPNTQYRTTLLSVAVDAIVGLTTQGLVAGVRHRAAQARSRERMLEQVNQVVHRLFDSPHPRTDVCEAARTISAAVTAFLYEPARDGSDHLICSAVAGINAPAVTLTVGRRSAAYDVLKSGQPMLITEDVEAHIGLIELWIAAGRPTALLYQPLLQGNLRLGVLVIAWPKDVRADGPRVTVAALLAHEAAAVIARADAMDHLSDEAQTDALTGLPNRRAWEARLARATATGQQLTVAILDFDHFKQFNDTHGHPAGDRLLKATAAAWRDQLRTGDILARIGGEEFGLLLPDCGAQTAGDIIQRLRATVTDNRTCSAGLATRLPDEDIESVIARADQALYHAKRQGRNRMHSSLAVEPPSTTLR
jgi:diguanylate cyclase (GGDEF)-like protein